MPQWKISKIFKKFIYTAKQAPFTLYVKDYTKNVQWKNPINSILIPYFAFLTKDIKSYKTVLQIDNINKSIHGNIIYDNNSEYESDVIYLRAANIDHITVGRPSVTGIVVCGKIVNIKINLLAITYAKRADKRKLISDNVIITIVDYDTNEEYYRSNNIQMYYGEKIEINTTIDFKKYIINKRLGIRVYNLDNDIILYQTQLSSARVIVTSQPFIPYRSYGQLNIIKDNNIVLYDGFSVNIPISNRIFLEFSDDVRNGKTLYGFGSSGITNVYVDDVKVLTIDGQNYQDPEAIYSSALNAFGLLLFDLGTFDSKTHTLKIIGEHSTKIPSVKIYYVNEASYNINNINVLAFEEK